MTAIIIVENHPILISSYEEYMRNIVLKTVPEPKKIVVAVLYFLTDETIEERKQKIKLSFNSFCL